MIYLNRKNGPLSEGGKNNEENTDNSNKRFE